MSAYALLSAPCRDRALTTDSNSTRPSALPSTRSQARSGCGIRPTTLRASLQIPAMLRTEPFGLAASLRSALRVAVAEDDAAARLQRVDHLGVGEVVAFAVSDRQLQHLAGRRRAA